MKKAMALVCFGLACAVSMPVFAGAQQEKMKMCNAEAKDMKGDERKAFMKECLSSKKQEPKQMAAKAAAPAAPAAPATPMAAASQQDRMKMCSAEAKTKALMGDARKIFMSECLKK